MVARLLLHPFTIQVNGSVATAEQGSEPYLASQVEVVIGTRIGERDMCTPFGVPDSAFGRLSAADVQTCIDRFGPDHLRIVSVDTAVTGELVETASVTWERT